MPDASTDTGSVEWWLFRAHIDAPVRNAFGTMTARPALFVRLAAADGAYGWGEVWCNFPTIGGEHRARLIETVFKPLIMEAKSLEPRALRAMLERRTRLLALQCAEPGPFQQIIAAFDQAAWDLDAR